MRLKRILTTTFLASILTLGMGLFVANNDKAEIKPAEAAAGDINYYLTGKFSGVEHWNNYKAAPSDGTNPGVLLNLSLKAGDLFKFKKPSTWDDALGFDKLKGGSAKNAFKEASTDKNIEVVVAGTYNLYIGTDYNIYIEFNQGTDVYVQIQDWANTYVYVFDETTKSGTTLKPFGDWPGTKITAWTAATNFNGSLGAIAKLAIPYHTLANTKLIVHNNAGTQSADQVLGSNYYYKKDGNSGSSSDGAQAKVVFDIESAIEAATNKSVCAVSKTDAGNLVNAYDALSDKTKINASTYYTWKSTTGGEMQDYTYAQLVYQLRRIASSSSPSNVLSIMGLNDNSSMITVVIISFLGITALGGYFFFRKTRKESD